MQCHLLGLPNFSYIIRSRPFLFRFFPLHFISGLGENLLAFYRDSASSPFTAFDQTLISNSLEQITITRENIKTLTLKNKLLPSLLEIDEYLDRTLFIEIKDHYCCLNLENDETNLELRVPLKTIQSYFGEERLIKVQKSYLVNPKKISSIQKISAERYQDYEIHFQNSSAAVPISRMFLKKISKQFPQFF